jgi:hypothetical protein
MGHGDGLVTRQSGFQDATDIITFCFVTIGIAEMRFDPRNPITKSADCAFHAGLNKSDDLLAPMDMVIRMDLNLHPTPSFTRTVSKWTLLALGKKSQSKQGYG